MQHEEEEEADEHELHESEMERIWTSFFNRVFEITEEAVQSRKLPLEDLRVQEPYLYLGVIGVAVLQCALRSRHAPGLLLAHGRRRLHPLRLPAVHRPALAAMEALGDDLPSTNHPHQLQCLEQIVLYGQSERKVVTSLDDATVVHLRQLASRIQAVAIHISQQPVFRRQFREVLDMLLQLYREV